MNGVTFPWQQPDDGLGPLRSELRAADSAYRTARRQRLQLILRAASAGMKHKEIGEVVGVTRSSVSQLLRAARERSHALHERGRPPGR